MMVLNATATSEVAEVEVTDVDVAVVNEWFRENRGEERSQGLLEVSQQDVRSLERAVGYEGLEGFQVEVCLSRQVKTLKIDYSIYYKNTAGESFEN